MSDEEMSDEEEMGDAFRVGQRVRVIADPLGQRSLMFGRIVAVEEVNPESITVGLGDMIAWFRPSELRHVVGDMNG